MYKINYKDILYSTGTYSHYFINDKNTESQCCTHKLIFNINHTSIKAKIKLKAQ